MISLTAYKKHHMNILSRSYWRESLKLDRHLEPSSLPSFSCLSSWQTFSEGAGDMRLQINARHLSLRTNKPNAGISWCFGSFLCIAVHTGLQWHSKKVTLKLGSDINETYSYIWCSVKVLCGRQQTHTTSPVLTSAWATLQLWLCINISGHAAAWLLVHEHNITSGQLLIQSNFWMYPKLAALQVNQVRGTAPEGN